MKDTTANRLKKALEIRRLTQAELAEKTELSKSAISQYLSGKFVPKQNALYALSLALDVSIPWLMGFDTPLNNTLKNEVPLPADLQGRGVKIPILGKVTAGVPCEAIEDTLGYIEISPKQAMNGPHFALQIKGQSMYPKIDEGDIVVVQKNFEMQDGDVVIVSINGDEATCKQIFERENGIMIQAFNPAVFPTQVYSSEEIESLPITILGKVIERRTSF